MECQDIIGIIISYTKDILTIISLGIASFVAVRGLQTWKSQLKGTNDYELAKRVLKAVYKLRNAINYVRSPLMTAGEISKAMKEIGIEAKITDSDYSHKSNMAVYNMRWKKVSEAFEDLEIEAIESEVLWGKFIAESIIEIRKNVILLSTAITLFINNLESHRHFSPDDKTRQYYEKIIYNLSLDENDEFSSSLLEKIKNIENLIKPYLKK